MKKYLLKLCLACLFAVVVIGCKKKEKDPEIKFYKVGDLYSEGGEEALVYKVVTLSGGMYAMAVSLDEAELPWSLEAVKTNANDLDNGMKNQEAIQAIQGWKEKYPAFKWCADKNKNGSGGWYFASPGEMNEMFLTELEYEGEMLRLGYYLTKIGATGFAESDEHGLSPYWSSMETSSLGVAASANTSKYSGQGYDKNTVHKVRAIKYIRIY